jgi:outer membrane protein TolC
VDLRNIFSTVAMFTVLISGAQFFATRCCAAEAGTSHALTLEQVLELAKTNNAQLPVARLQAQIAGQAVTHSQGKLGPRIYVSGNVPYSPPILSYSPGATPNEASILLNAEQPIYAGDTLRGQLKADQYSLDAAEAGYQVGLRDLELLVRSRFSEMLLYDAQIAIESEGIERLRTYLKMIKLRKAAGRGVQADLLKTEVRLDEQLAVLISAQRSRGEARVELNTLMGRMPAEALELVSMPEPKEIPSVSNEEAHSVPDLVAAQADLAAAEAQASVVSGRYLPHFNLFANTGLIDPGLGVPNSVTSFSDRLRGDLGVAIGVNLRWDIWNFGAYRAEIAQAGLTAEKAAASVLVTRRKQNHDYEKAHVDLLLWFDEYKTRSHQVPVARDAYLASESLYWGGQGTTLSVLDSFSSLVNAQTSNAKALYQLRVAHAELLRRSGEP